MEAAIPWLAQPELNWGCADISYQWASRPKAELIVRMHFSRVRGGWPKDMEIVFPHPLALMWESESYGLIEIPGELPRLKTARFVDWVFPTIIVENSRWAERYAARKFAADDPLASRVRHYYLSSLNDLLHVLNQGVPETRWVETLDA